MINSKRNYCIFSVFVTFNIRNHSIIGNKNFFRTIVNVMQIFMHRCFWYQTTSHIEVFWKFRMKTGSIWNFVFLTHHWCTKSNRSFGNNMQKIWFYFCNFFPNFSRKSEWKLNFFITKKWHTEKIICRNGFHRNIFWQVFHKILDRTSNAVHLLAGGVCDYEKCFPHKFFSIFLVYENIDFMQCFCVFG